jgi:hypothetical protein
VASSYLSGSTRKRVQSEWKASCVAAAALTSPASTCSAGQKACSESKAATSALPACMLDSPYHAPTRRCVSAATYLPYEGGETDESESMHLLYRGGERDERRNVPVTRGWGPTEGEAPHEIATYLYL